MTDREKVMRGAECCTKDVYDPFSCEECPYLGHKPTKKGCISVMLEDVIALLKGHEPRVMTFEEVYKFSCKAFDQYGEDSPLYVECRERYPYQIKWLTVERAHEWMRDDETMERRKLTYNNAKERWGWRCWTSRPSPEQMTNTPWEGGEADGG